MGKLKNGISIIIILTALASLLLCSADAIESARRGLSLCARIIIPSLLPFFILSALIVDIGLPAYLGSICAPFMSRLFGVSGAGASAFILGITGGYPLGAGVISGLVSRGEVSKEEGTRLLTFCNNSGPAFIVGAAGVGIFGSAAIGLMLYAAHVLAAATVGVLFSRGGRRWAQFPAPRKSAIHIELLSLAESLPAAVRSSVTTILTVCGFIVTFTVCVGLLDSLGIFPRLAGELAHISGLNLQASRALLTGLLEIGSGVGSMTGFSPSPGNLALCAFILGWGGISVHFQTLAVIAGTGIKTARHTAGRLLCGVLSAIYVLGLCLLF